MTVKARIKELADKYAQELQINVIARTDEMRHDDRSHYLIYRILGVSAEEGAAIDLYQNKGRFLYRYAGAFLEQAARLCFIEKYPNATPLRIPNTLGTRPKTFEIDCLVEGDAYEVKWRDATTDGDHITKEHTRIKGIAAAGYVPIRVMFYYPNRKQAVKIQAILEDLYKAVGGLYYHGDSAWSHILEKTDIDLKRLIEEIATERES